MKEKFLQYIWKMKAFGLSDLKTTDGEIVSIYYNGEHNSNAGPDFLNAKIKIGDTIWAGNIEIHLKTSQWHLHKHSENKSFDNVILHVVLEHDSNENNIPVLELRKYIKGSLIVRYETLMKTSNNIPCEKHIFQIEKIIIKQQLDRMIAERIEIKAMRFEQRLSVNKNDWEQTCYQLLARNFGTYINADPFERVATGTPFQIIRKLGGNIFQIEALLFGQAGFLDASLKELYPHQLGSEYAFLRKKYRLDPIQKSEWKFLRLRPANFPTIKMSQFANFVAQHENLFQTILQLPTYKAYQEFFQCDASAFWKEHYSFKKSSKVKSVALGRATIDLLIINTVAPLIFLYGIKTGEQLYIDKAINLLEQIPAEKNAEMRTWQALGLKILSASESQALFQLKKEYCSHKRCLECAIGNAIINNPVSSENNF